MSDLAARLAAYEHRLDVRADELTARAGNIEAPGAFLPGRPQPTDVHRRLVDLFDAVLSMGVKAEQGHPMLRASLRTIRKLRPVALEELARVPEDEVKVFMGQLVQQLAGAIGFAELADIVQLLARVPEPVMRVHMGRLLAELREAIGEGVDDGDATTAAGAGARALEDLAAGAGAGVAGGGNPDRQVDPG